MGTSAERRTGYFSTSASKRAASFGEKMDIVSGFISLGLIASTPAPKPRPSYPSLPRLSPRATFLLQSTPVLRFAHLRSANSLENRCAADRATLRRAAP